MKIPIKKLTADARLPTYAHVGDAGMDLYAREAVTCPPGERVTVPTGIAMAIPEGYAGLVWDKSGLATTYGITTIAGVIDAGYRGEVCIAVYNTGSGSYTFQKGEKVAQMLIQQVVAPELVEEDINDETTRGERGFGSTGST